MVSSLVQLCEFHNHRPPPLTTIRLQMRRRRHPLRSLPKSSFLLYLRSFQISESLDLEDYYILVEMLNDQRVASRSENQDYRDEHVRDIHALAPPLPPPNTPFTRDTWETNIHRLSSLSMAGTEYSALVLAEGSTIGNNGSENDGTISNIHNLRRILEEQMAEERNPFAIVADNSSLNPLPSPRLENSTRDGSIVPIGDHEEGLSVQKVKKEEVESKISAWKNAHTAKINNRFKREEAIVNGWENEQVQKFTSSMKKVERKLEEKRARAFEKMQNDIAKAHRKAEERRATSESSRGRKVAEVLEVANLMRALGRAPAKRSFF